MTVNHSLVPSLGRHELLAIHTWTATQQRTREAYRREPVTVCGRCAEGKHHQCTAVRDDGHLYPCPCEHRRKR